MEDSIKPIFRTFDDLITARYPARVVQSNDTNPIVVNCDNIGPLTVRKGYLLCDCCGSIIRQNYLNNHRSSGACTRLASKRSNKPYGGPYVRIDKSGDFFQ